MKTFIESFDFVHMAPDKVALQGDLPASVTARVLAERGRQYAVYLQGGMQADIRLALPAGTYAVEWRDTQTGKVAGKETLRHPGGVATIHSPVYVEDIALSVRAMHRAVDEWTQKNSLAPLRRKADG